MSGPRSLLLITSDCLRADHVGFLGYKRGTTPFLDTLAAESLTFSNAIVAGNPTYYSFPAIMASRFPLGLGRDVVGLAPGEPTLAGALKDAGYSTAGFSAGNAYLSERFGYESGFETFQDFLGNAEGAVSESAPAPLGPSRLNRRIADFAERSETLRAAYWELYFRYGQWRSSSQEASFDKARRTPPADVLVNQAFDWLDGVKDKPFFLWLHFMDTHAPYYPREQAIGMLGEPPMPAARALYLNSFWQRLGINARRFRPYKRDIITLYDAAIRWVDTQVARLVARLRERGLWEDCVLCFTADHGEEFLEHGGRFHSPAKVIEELIRVPLLIHAPQAGAIGPRPNPFSLLDLAPTLLGALGKLPPEDFHGRDRWRELLENRAAATMTVTESLTSIDSRFYRENRVGPRIFAVRDTRYKLVFNFETGTEELFDLQSDPGELRPLPLNSQEEVRKRLLKRMAQHMAESSQRRDAQRRSAAILRDIVLESAPGGQPS
jgi:arylsulfatase A-like enzyme